MSAPRMYRLGIPAAGHITSHGFWHPGAIDGCVKCPADTVPDSATPSIQQGR